MRGSRLTKVILVVSVVAPVIMAVAQITALVIDEYRKQTLRLSKSNEALMGLSEDVREIERLMKSAKRGTPEYDDMIVRIRDMTIMYPVWNQILELLDEHITKGLDDGGS